MTPPRLTWCCTQKPPLSPLHAGALHPPLPRLCITLIPREQKKKKKHHRNHQHHHNNHKHHQTILTSYFPIRRSSRKTSQDLQKEKLQKVEEAILTGKEDGFQVKEFPEKGRGVVSLHPISRGDFVLEYSGELIGLEEARRREQIYANCPSIGCYMYYFTYLNKPFCVDATAESGRLGRLVNHSRTGANLATKTVLVHGRPHLVLVALRDIAAGEELMYDYGDRSRRSLEAHPWLAT